LIKPEKLLTFRDQKRWIFLPGKEALEMLGIMVFRIPACNLSTGWF